MEPQDTSPPFFTRYGLSRTGVFEAPLRLEPYAEICHRGVLRPAVIASAIDIVGGLNAREIAGDDSTFTTDLSVRAPADTVPDVILARGTLLRVGRRVITTCVILEADGETYAYGETSFMRVAQRREATGAKARLGMPEVIEQVPLERPLHEEVGIEIVDPARGEVRVELREPLRNPEGVMQGALVALLCEVAAETLADHSHGCPQVVREIDVRYLAMARVGPIVSLARWIGAPDAGMLRVELRDRGNEERITAATLLRTAPAPAG